MKRKIARAYAQLRQYVRNTDEVSKALWEIQTETARQASMIDRKLSDLVAQGQARTSLQQQQTGMILEFLKAYAAKNALPFDASTFAVADISADDFRQDSAGINHAAFQKPPESGKAYETTFAKMPLMLDEHTHNVFHPHYDAAKARNFSGRIFNADAPCSNPVYAEIRHLAHGTQVPDRAWKPMFRAMMDEVKSIPESRLVFERKAHIESYIEEISARYKAHYAPGWVTLEDALFLYWLVRTHKPRTIVQTGVCNGLSSAFMAMAQAKNNNGGKLHVIDMPPVFNPADPVWTVADKVYGVVIPEGKTSGWIVPEQYRNHFEVISGDAREHLPKLVDRLDSIDMFYHDSDHTYGHMMFEFRQAKRKLAKGGLMLGDDISWNASLWDFADEFGVPAYNFKTRVGVAFF